MTTRDEKGGVFNCKDKGGGSGWGLPVYRNRALERIGQELEVEVFEVDQEIAEVVGKGLVDKVVEVYHLEDLGSQEQSIGPLKYQNYHDDKG